MDNRGHARRKAAAIAFAPLLLALLALQGAAAAVYGDYRDWSVVCSNGLTCTFGFSDYDNDGLRSIGFRRSAEPRAPLRFVLPFPDGFDPGADGGGRFDVSIDGEAAFTLLVSDMIIDTQADELLDGDPERSLRLLAAMKAGSALTIRYDGPAGKAALAVSLSGVTASALRVDEVQGRVGRKDALHAKGAVPPPDVAPVRALAAIADLPASIRPDFTGPTADCGGWDGSPGFAFGGAFEIALDSGARLIGAPCGPPGAYNQPFAFYGRYGPDDPSFDRLSLPVMLAEGPAVEMMVYNIAYDPATQTMESFFRGRGLGDCGSFMRWKMHESGYGPGFVLVEQREKGACDGDYAGGPQNWPARWPLE